MVLHTHLDRRRFLQGAGLAAASVAATAWLLTDDAAAETLLAIADSYVDSASQNGNFGAASTLKACACTKPKHALVKFPAASGPATVTVNVQTIGASGTLSIRPTSTAWTETGPSGVTWRNKPTLTNPVLASRPIPAGGGDVTFDVGAVSGETSFYIHSSTSAVVELRAREQGALGPRLSFGPPPTTTTVAATTTSTTLAGGGAGRYHDSYDLY
jgi:hypothetical protein